ncbi:MAG: glycosyltransferase [Sphingobacteriales bacterium]|jgi:glycosyltransferase involved in cell wall biosynthesis|nr:glycosyltransferase [Sphingobacteriales bacterium]
MNSQNPLISIVTPVFNGEKFIEDCILNVRNQSFRNYEHIIIDSCSTDNTPNIINQFINDSQIKYIVKKDNSLYEGMNNGIKEARGEWLYFFGSDDAFVNNTVLEKISHVLVQKSEGAVYGDVWLEKLGRWFDGRFNIEKILTNNICHQAIFYHKSVFEKVSLYNLNYKILSDYDMNLKCILGNKASFEYHPLRIARFADGGVSSWHKDDDFENDYAKIILQYTLNGNWNWLKKYFYLSICFRKILLRNKLRQALNEINKNLKPSGAFLMFLFFAFTTPFLLIRKLFE